MARMFNKTIVLLLLLSLIMSTPLLTYDPSASSATVTLLEKDSNSFRWLFKRLVSTTYSFESIQLDMTAATPNKVLTKIYSDGTVDYTLKAISASYNCAVLAAGTTKLSVIKFNAATQLLENLIASQFVAAGSEAAAVAKSYQVADDCTAFSSDTATYRYDSTVAGAGTKFVADSPTIWVSPVFSADFSYAAANDGLYRYVPKTASAAGFYERILQLTNLENKKVWASSAGIVVASWDSTGTGDIKNYKVHGISKPLAGETAHTLAGSIEGQFYNTVAKASPDFSVAKDQTVVSVYGKSSATAFFSKVKKFKFESKSSSEITLPSWAVETESTVSVSNSFIYIRNVVVKTGTTSKFHGGFNIDGVNINPYLAPVALVGGELTDFYVRSLLEVSPSGELYVLREHNSLATKLGQVTLEPAVYSPEGQILKFDRSAGVSAAVLTGDGTTFQYVNGKPVWFSETKPDAATTKLFKAVNINENSNMMTTASLSTDDKKSVKALSKNLKCALIYDITGTGTLRTYDFYDSGNDRTVSTSKTVPSTIYTGITLTDVGTKFAVSDDCYAVRINNIVATWDGASYTSRAFPTGTSFTSPAFSEDLTVIVDNNGVYAYSPTNRNYSLIRTETYQANKSAWRDRENIVIFTYEQSATAGVYNAKIQFNSITLNEPITITKFNETTGQARGIPSISISPKLTKVLIGGIDSADSNKMNYVGRSIDWLGKNTKELALPATVTGAINTFAINEQFLYVRNSNGATPKQYGYLLLGSTLTEVFNENALVSAEGYTRSMIIKDIQNAGKMIVVHEYNNGAFVRVVKEAKRNSQEVLNPNQVPPYEMTFTYPTSVRRMQTPSFGRWLWTETVTPVAGGSQTVTLNWLEYDPSQQGKKKTIQKTSLTDFSSIIALSPSFDCAILSTGSTLDSVKFDNANAGSATLTNHWATVNPDFTTPALGMFVMNQGVVKAGDGCWAFRVRNNVYVKPATAGAAYVKSAVSSTDFATAIFDNSLKFALVPDSTGGAKIYKYGTTDYVNIFNVTGLKTTTFIYSSPDLNKLLIYSYTTLGFSSPFDTVIRLYVSDQTTFAPVTLPNNGAFVTRIGEAKLYFDPSFETIVVGFGSGTDEVPEVSITFAQVNFTTKTVTPYEIPSVFYSWVNPRFYLFGDYVYAMQPSLLNPSAGIEYFFKLDKANLKIIEITKRPIVPEEYSKFRGGKIVQQNGLMSVLYDSEPTYGTVWVIKRGVGSPTLQNAIKDIIPQDAGFLIENGQIRLCPPGCSYCVNPTRCSVCSTGYVMNTVTSSCVRCGPLCATCSQSDPNTCSTCVDGYYKKTDATTGVVSCARCHESCVTCNNLVPTTCISCKIGSYLDGTSCTECISNCLSCTSGATNACDICKPGYVYHNPSKSCVKCIAGCAVCNPTQIYSCVSCGAGFEPVLTNNTISQCKACPPRCRNCTSGNCTECRPGFRLVNNNCTEQCRLPCKECSETKADNCTSCLLGYTLAEGGVCSPDLSCNANKSCTSCPIGFNLVAGECKQCNGGPNCRTCDNMDIDKCASCIRGFFLSSTLTCAPCNITGCAACDNPVYCSQCRPGFILAGTGSSAKCTKCADQCGTCFESPNNCDSCAPGFTKKGWNCVSNTNIKLTLVLAGNFSALTTDQFTGIEEAVCNLTGKDRNQISIDELRSGSILMDTTINVDNAAQQTSLMNTLQTSLLTGASLGGFTIEATALQSISDVSPVKDDSEAIKYRNIAIIVGIVIPIGLIIIFIVLIVLIKKGIIFNNSNEPTKVRDATMDEIQLQDGKSLQ